MNNTKTIKKELQTELSRIATSLLRASSNVQKNALDTSTAVRNIQVMSNQSAHEKTIAAILDDNNIDMETKLKLKHEEDQH